MPHSAVIMGLGAFGGGIGAARHLAEMGHDVLVTDLRTPEQLEPSLQRLQDLIGRGSVSLRLGEHNVSDFTTAELVVVNPAVKQPWDNRFVRAALAAGVRTTTEIALALDAIPEACMLIGITGSAGKSTTSAMVHAGLVASGRSAALGGNIGGSLLDRLGDLSPEHAVVLELSSAQLWWLDQPRSTTSARWLDVGVVTNLAPNHIDWHATIDHYTASKRVIFDRLASGSAAIIGDGSVAFDPPQHASRLSPVDPDSLPDLAIPGAHNRQNAAVAIAACVAAGADRASAVAGIAAFAGLPHRLALVGERRGVRYYNDSKSTTPEATRLALEAMGTRPVHLIVGGSDKGIDLRPLADLRPRVRSLLCIGQTGAAIAGLAGVEPVVTLDRAVEIASQHAETGDAVVLSPGCASFDQFTSYEHRGDTFVSLVRSLP